MSKEEEIKNSIETPIDLPELELDSGSIGNQINMYGNCGRFKTLYHIQQGTYIENVQALETGNGCLVRTSVRDNGLINQAITFVPGVKLKEEDSGKGHYMVSVLSAED